MVNFPDFVSPLPLPEGKYANASCKGTEDDVGNDLALT